MTDVYKIKTIGEAEIKDIDMGSRTIVQRFTTYNVKDSDGDIGRKGMFNKTWSENFSRIKHLLNHDISKPLGKIEKLWDDEIGAYGKSKIGTHSLGDDFLKMADSGLITEASYGYNTVKENKIKDGNELLEVRQWEFSSLTAWGANQYTPIISISKSATKEDQLTKISERIKAVEKFCKNTTATDDTIELLLLEIKMLHQLFIDLTQKNTTEPDTSTQPDLSKDDELLNTIKQFTQNLNRA